MSDACETSRSTPARIELEMIVDAAPEPVWRAFVDAELLTLWWAQEADCDPVPGGVLEARWPTMGWTMRGTYLELDPPRTVAFTWSWDHEPDTPVRTVRVSLAPHGDGTRLTLTHGDYSASDAEERRGHLEGWQHFLPKLAAAVGP
jgi:uncharacterized protein YndB with AHSA1/START domain